MEINEYQKLAMRTINKDLSERDILKWCYGIMWRIR